MSIYRECIDYLHQVDFPQFVIHFGLHAAFGKLLWLLYFSRKKDQITKSVDEIIQNAMFVVIGTKYNERFQLQF